MAEFQVIHERRFGGVTIRHVATGQEAYISYKTTGRYDQTHVFTLPEEIGGEAFEGRDKKAARDQAVETAKGLLRRQYEEATNPPPLEVSEAEDIAWRFPSAACAKLG